MIPNGARTDAIYWRTLLLALLVTFVLLSVMRSGNRSSAQVALQGGNAGAAIEELNRAIAIQPNTGEYYAAISA